MLLPFELVRLSRCDLLDELLYILPEPDEVTEAATAAIAEREFMVLELALLPPAMIVLLPAGGVPDIW